MPNRCGGFKGRLEHATVRLAVAELALDQHALEPGLEPAFDLAAFDKLEDYALALSFAQTNFLTATQPPDDLQALHREASTLHDRLLADATALSHHDLVEPTVLQEW